MCGCQKFSYEIFQTKIMYAYTFAGPGEYDGTLPRLTHYSGLLCGRDKRFKSRKTTNPGPGAYSVNTHTFY